MASSLLKKNDLDFGFLEPGDLLLVAKPIGLWYIFNRWETDHCSSGCLAWQAYEDEDHRIDRRLTCRS